MATKYDFIIVGTGFASSFFLKSLLDKTKATDTILVLERGRLDSHAWQIDNQRSSSMQDSSGSSGDVINRNPAKQWVFNLTFGGGSNGWWASIPRFMPSDFRMKSAFGVGIDWPIGYEDLADYYERAEIVFAASGPDLTPFPRRIPYPQPPHLLSDPEKRIQKGNPGTFFNSPSARARVATARRPACCAIGTCSLCPVDAKFTVINEMAHLYQDPRVTLMSESRVLAVETAAGMATGVRYIKDGVESVAAGSQVALGANALFNAHILYRSNLPHPLLGKHLNEQVSVRVDVNLDGLDHFQGSTSITGHGYMFYDDKYRARQAAALIEFANIVRPGSLRPERGKWRRRMGMKFIFEDLPRVENYINFLDDDPDRIETVYAGHSDYTQRGIDSLPDLLPGLLDSLPVESYTISEKHGVSEAHILGTTMMGNDPETSVIDKHLIHHQIRNLAVLGAGAFPTGSPSNPTLTLSALSLWAADHIFG